MNIRQRFVHWLMFLTGGTGYSLIEIFWRQYTHWTMFLLGGICFLAIERISSKLKDKYPLWQICIVSALVITVLEFITGCVVNLMLGWDVWNYSNMPFNIMGQICIMFMVLWYLLCIPVTWLAGKMHNFFESIVSLSAGTDRRLR